MSRMVKVDKLEEWILEELAEKYNWTVITGMDEMVLYCNYGDNQGTLVGNVTEVEVNDDLIALTSLFSE